MTRLFGFLLLLLAAAPSGRTDGFVSLMPKKDISEHWIAESAPADIWWMENGMIRCKGQPNGFLRSRKSYRNYIFRAEWRFKAEGWQGAPDKYPNAGFFINAGAVEKTWPASLEVQGHFGEAGSVFGVAGNKIKGARRGPIVPKRVPFGTWDRYEITQKDGKLTVKLNGELVNEGWEAEPAEGNICLQSEGWPVDYRNIEIQELP